MNNKIENQLVIASGSDSVKKYHLLKKIITVGSAPYNDVQLNDRGVSDFHAEIRFNNNTFEIVDLNSDEGIYVNGERIVKERHLVAGDRIQMGSAQAYFEEHNAITTKKGNLSENIREVFKRLKPYFGKQLTKRKKNIFVCGLPIIAGLPIMAVIMIALMLSKNCELNHKESAVQQDRVARSMHVREGKDAKKEIKIDSGTNNADEIDTITTSQKQNSSLMSLTGTRQNQTSIGRQDYFADIYLEIANKFADEHLWQIALEYYLRVFEKNSDNATLSARIAMMKSEIQNQIIFEKGQALIKKEHYDKGIKNLQQLSETSYYFRLAVQLVAEAEENMAKTKK